MNICIFQPAASGYSETFLRAHAEKLPGHVTVVHGQSLPGETNDGRDLMVLLSPIKRAIWRFRHRLPAIFSERAAMVPAQAFRKFLESARIDVVLAEYGPTATLIGAVCQATKVPYVVHFHGYDAYVEDVVSQNDYYQTIFDSAAGVVAVSQAMRRRLLSLGCPAGKLHFSPSGVDLELFTPARPASNPAHFVSVGRFVDKKAPQLTLLAFIKVVEEVPDATLTMIGDGGLQEACRQIARSYGVQDKVNFRGILSPADVQGVLNGARAFVQHSLQTTAGDSEGTPVAVLEAGACGLPVVSTRHAGIPDVVIDSETGFLVEEGDVEGMAMRMACLAKNPALAARLGECAAQRIREHYSMEGSISRLSEILNSATRAN